MKRINASISLAVAAAVFTTGAASALAATDIRITEVAPWSSGNSSVAADWFELTNMGAAAIDVTGWKVDDNSNAFGSAVTLTGISSIGAGESVVFLESSSANPPATVIAAFKSTWFGASAPSALQIGTYQGSGIGLGTGGDAVNVFSASGILQAKVTFGASVSGPFSTFDNSSGQDNTLLTTLSAIGVNGAFTAVNGNALGEIGSPGLIAAVPEPETYALMLLGLGLARLRARSASRRT